MPRFFFDNTQSRLKNEGDKAADIHSLSEKGLISLERPFSGKTAPDLSRSRSPCEGNSLP